MKGTLYAQGGNRTVWKFPVRDLDNVIALPKGAQFLHFGAQGNDLVFWALVDTTKKDETEERRFVVLPTGFSSLPPDGYAYRYHGSAQRFDGTVWHLFEAVSPTLAFMENLPL